jgi:hypothetical protein
MIDCLSEKTFCHAQWNRHRGENPNEQAQDRSPNFFKHGLRGGKGTTVRTS